MAEQRRKSRRGRGRRRKRDKQLKTVEHQRTKLTANETTDQLTSHPSEKKPSLEQEFVCDVEQYPMNNPRRGKAIIFNQMNFDQHLRLESRNGSEKDAEMMGETLKSYGFSVEIKHDSSSQEIDECLRGVSLEDHSDTDMFACIYLSHGSEGGLYSANKFFPIQKLWQYFSEANCSSLAGKPKLFIIQACRGNKLDKGVEIKTKELMKTTAHEPTSSDGTESLRRKSSTSEEQKEILKRLFAYKKKSLTTSQDSLNSDDLWQSASQSYRRKSAPSNFFGSGRRESLTTVDVSRLKPLGEANSNSGSVDSLQNLKYRSSADIEKPLVIPKELLNIRRSSDPPIKRNPSFSAAFESNLLPVKEGSSISESTEYMRGSLTSSARVSYTSLSDYYENADEIEEEMRENSNNSDSSTKYACSQESFGSNGILSTDKVNGRFSLPNIAAQTENASICNNSKRLSRCRTKSESKGLLYSIPSRQRLKNRFDISDSKAMTSENEQICFDSEPEIPDTLIAYSTVQGYFSWRNERSGSWFIQEICEVLNKRNGGNIFDLLQEVNRNIGRERQSSCAEMNQRHNKKQSCCLVSTLTKELILHKKTKIS